MKNNILISPSVMCADLVNLESSIRELESLGLDRLHIDILDANFSPSMPLGIDTIKRLREITDLDFDVHIMSMNNEFFIQEMIRIGVESITFHLETSLHADRYINLIKEAGIKVGVALNPTSSLTELQYILPLVDSVTLMLINPGFATNKNEKQISYANQKISDLSEMIQTLNLDVLIQVDGRVSLDTIPDLVSCGANDLVVGSTGLFIKNVPLDESYATLNKRIQEGVIKKNAKL